jgi:hypothetical protein
MAEGTVELNTFDHREEELSNSPIWGEKYSPLVLFRFVDSLINLAERPKDYNQLLKALIGNNPSIRKEISDTLDSKIENNRKTAILEVMLANLRDI